MVFPRHRGVLVGLGLAHASAARSFLLAAARRGKVEFRAMSKRSPRTGRAAYEREVKKAEAALAHAKAHSEAQGTRHVFATLEGLAGALRNRSPGAFFRVLKKDSLSHRSDQMMSLTGPELAAWVLGPNPKRVPLACARATGPGSSCLAAHGTHVPMVVATCRLEPLRLSPKR